jgi:hypothetical protein
MISDGASFRASKDQLPQRNHTLEVPVFTKNVNVIKTLSLSGACLTPGGESIQDG